MAKRLGGYGAVCEQKNTWKAGCKSRGVKAFVSTIVALLNKVGLQSKSTQIGCTNTLDSSVLILI